MSEVTSRGCDPELHQAVRAQIGERPRIAIQGEFGSNSANAAKQLLPDAEVVPCESFSEAFGAIAADLADLSLIPVENSSAGRVADPHQLLPDAGLHIIAEEFLPIRFDLVAPTGASITEVTTVRSHTHAFGQCLNLLDQYHWERQVAADTAGAAREVAELKDPQIAALAPSGIAERYGLQVLAAGVEDNPHNATRFLLLSPEPIITTQRPAITSLLFRVRNVPAALYKALGGFATNAVNMTKLESYQLGGSFQASQFYMDIDGHVDDRPVQLAIEELRFFCTDMTVMGCYRAHAYRERYADSAKARLG